MFAVLATASVLSYVTTWLQSGPREEVEEEKVDHTNDVDPPCDVDEDCECKYGFKRKDFKKGDITGKIPFHTKHIFLSSGKKYTEWPDKIEDEEGSLAKFLTKYYKKQNEKIRISCIEAASKSGTDVYVFPDMIKYLGAKEENFEGLAEAIAKGRIYTQLESVKITGTWVFVCCHQARDKRCGACGPRIYLEFKEKLKNKTVKEQQLPVHVNRCSHCSAHTYAGNVIIYKLNSQKRKYYGDIYGFVNLQDVERLIDSYIIKGKIPKDLWCGRANCEKDIQLKMLKFID